MFLELELVKWNPVFLGSHCFLNRVGVCAFFFLQTVRQKVLIPSMILVGSARKMAKSMLTETIDKGKVLI